MFKSYYVVWKPGEYYAPPRSYPRLNRTMQYGNFLRGHQVLRCADRFKSYYVVWKLDGLEQIICDEGLNRTMQYGNKNSRIDEACKIVEV